MDDRNPRSDIDWALASCPYRAQPNPTSNQGCGAVGCRVDAAVAEGCGRS